VSSARSLHAAIVQDSPIFGQLAASLEKAVTLAEQAAARGAQLICFGETWLPGYPAWLDHCPEAALWNHPAAKQVFADLRANSVVAGGPECALLASTARRLGAGIIMGVHERVDAGAGHGTLYNSILIFAPDGALAVHHRKLVPTYTEKLVWGYGDAAGLRCADVNGARVGAMVCWEHWMPLPRQHMHNQGEQVHAALWPTVHEMHQVASRHYAFEGRCFVLAAGSLMRRSELPAELNTGTGSKHDLLLRGGSAIIAPDGRYLAGPVYDQPAILEAVLDLSEIDREVMTLDVTGHYARPDIFSLQVKNSERTAAAVPASPETL
jgi:nitrilase